LINTITGRNPSSHSSTASPRPGKQNARSDPRGDQLPPRLMESSDDIYPPFTKATSFWQQPPRSHLAPDFRLRLPAVLWHSPHTNAQAVRASWQFSKLGRLDRADRKRQAGFSIVQVFFCCLPRPPEVRRKVVGTGSWSNETASGYSLLRTSPAPPRLNRMFTAQYGQQKAKSAPKAVGVSPARPEFFSRSVALLPGGIKKIPAGD